MPAKQDLDLAACKAGLNEEMVPDVHGLKEVGHAISYTVNKTRRPEPGPPHLPRSVAWVKSYDVSMGHGVKSSSPAWPSARSAVQGFLSARRDLSMEKDRQSIRSSSCGSMV